MSRSVVAAMAVLAILIVQASGAIVRDTSDNSRSPSANISRTATDSLTPVVAIAGDLVHVAWIESEQTTDGLRASIWYVRSTNRGSTFDNPRAVAPLTGYASALQCIAEGRTVHLSWLATSYTTGSPAAVDYQRSTDGGESFEPFVSVSGVTPPGAPVLVVSNGRVAALWQADDRMWLARSITDGAAFEEPQEIASTRSDSVTAVRAASSSEGLVLAWLEREPDGTSHLGVGRVNWTTQQLTESDSPETVAVSEVAAAASGDNVVVAWTTAGSARTASIARSVDGGATFAESRTLGSTGVLGSPRVTVGNDAAFACWLDSRGRLAVARLATDESIQSIRVRSNKRAVFPEILADADGAAVVWRSRQGASSVIRACTVGSTGEDSAVRTVAKRGGSAAAPRLAFDGEATLVVWQQIVDGAADVFINTLVDD